jgi:hypothetical protein
VPPSYLAPSVIHEGELGRAKCSIPASTNYMDGCARQMKMAKGLKYDVCVEDGLDHHM